VNKVISIEKGKRPNHKVNGEKLFSIVASESREVVYEVWASSIENALENLRKGQGFTFPNVESTSREIISVEEID